MKCMEYSNEHHINIIPQEDFEELTQEVFSVIAENLTKSLGPLGSSATIFDGTLVEATKDGYHILDKYIFHNRYKKMIYNLIKTPCTKMNNTVGDGTTTAIAFTNNLFQSYKMKEDKIKKLYRMPRQFTNAWDSTVEELIKKIRTKAKPIDPEDYDTIYHLAYISSNGNHEIAEAFAKTYKEAKSPAIKMKDSPTNKSYIEAVDGFEFPTNTIDVVYVRNQDMTAKEKDVATIIFDHKIETDEYKDILVPINEVLRAQGKKLIVIAPEYDAFMLDSEVKRDVSIEYGRYHCLNMILTQYPTGKLSAFQREDLAVVLRSIVVNQNIAARFSVALKESNIDLLMDKMEDDHNEFHGMIGIADSVLLSMENGAIFNVSNIEDDEKYQDTLAWAKKQLDDIMGQVDFEKKSYSSKIYEARSRIMQLEMKNYIYYIGADSELQKQIIHDAVEDVIKNLRSAIKNGVVPGCQISITRAAREMILDIDKAIITGQMDLVDYGLKNAVLGLIMDACEATYIQILCGPEGTGLSTYDYMNDKCTEMDPVQSSFFKANLVVNESANKNKVFDLETFEYTDDVITSAETDIMILTAASELIKILISGNQCVFLDSEVNMSHQDNVNVYV